MKKISTIMRLMSALLVSGVVMFAVPVRVSADGGSEGSEFTYTLSNHTFSVGSTSNEVITIYNNTNDDLTSVWMSFGGGKYSAGPPSTYPVGVSPSGGVFDAEHTTVDYEDNITIPANGSAQITVSLSSSYAYDVGTQDCWSSDDYSSFQISVGNADWSVAYDAPIECGIFSAIE